MNEEKEFINIFERLCRIGNAWQTWTDMITVMATSISNTVDKSKIHYEKREREYIDCISRIGSAEDVVKAMGIVMMAFENNPEQDFLGKIYMDLGLGSHWSGQFFTPYHICKMMAAIECRNVDHLIEEHGYISICDMACGAGATLIASANTMKTQGNNFQDNVLFIGQDIDRITGLMCYIQLSILGCAGYVRIGNAVTSSLKEHELFPQEGKGYELWEMPMFHSNIWNFRKYFTIMAKRII